MAGGIITISRRKYAAGLFWQPSGGVGGARENAAKIARIARMRAKLFIKFGSMIGLAPSRGRAAPGMPVAAPEVIEALGENNFLAVFSVREGYWILSVRGGIIIKDAVFPDAETAAKEYMSLNAMPDWKILIAPANWNAPAAVEKNLADMVSGNKKYRLSNISNLPGYIMTFILLAAACFVGYKFFEEPIGKMLEPKPERLDLAPEIVEEYKAKLEEIEAPPPKPVPKKVRLPMPYDDLPSLADKADQCHRAIAFLSQPVAGWSVETASCVDGAATARLLRSHGTIGDLYDEVRNKMPGVSIDETGGNSVVLNAKLRPLGTSKQEPVYSADEIMTAVQSVFQRINEDVDFRRDFIEIKPPEADGDYVDGVDAPIVRIDAATKLQPKEFIKIMNDLNGIQMPKVVWDNKNRNWIYEVIIFVK